MSDTAAIHRRHFLARALGFIVGGAWLGIRAPREAAAGSLPYLAEVRMFAGDFAPVGWLLCNGQILDISSYDALFSLIGTMYGGDGQETFALPDLRGRAPVHMGTTIVQGEMAGVETVTLGPTQIPTHSHTLVGSSSAGGTNDPTGRVPSRNPFGWPHYNSGMDTALAASAVMSSGSSTPHNNTMPSLCINFIICTEGIYPPCHEHFARGRSRRSPRFHRAHRHIPRGHDAARAAETLPRRRSGRQSVPR